jgi:hypothetical protein
MIFASLTMRTRNYSVSKSTSRQSCGGTCRTKINYGVPYSRSKSGHSYSKNGCRTVYRSGSSLVIIRSMSNFDIDKA